MYTKIFYISALDLLHLFHMMSFTSKTIVLKRTVKQDTSEWETKSISFAQGLPLQT